MDSHYPRTELIGRAIEGDERALASCFNLWRHRLRQMVRLRIDSRLKGRVDPSDVLQEAFLDLVKELPEFTRKQSMPLFLWMRMVTGQRLTRMHRHHLGAKMRDASRDISIHRGRIPPATSASLAAQLLGRATTPGHAILRAEIQLQLQDALDSMSPIDREVIALRNFEELDSSETASVLGISTEAAGKRYIRALMRLQEILRRVPGLVDGGA